MSAWDWFNFAAGLASIIGLGISAWTLREVWTLQQRLHWERTKRVLLPMLVRVLEVRVEDAPPSADDARMIGNLLDHIRRDAASEIASNRATAKLLNSLDEMVRSRQQMTAVKQSIRILLGHFGFSQRRQ